MLSIQITQTELGHITGVTKAAAWQWLHGRRPIPIPHCPAIERATGGAVMRWDLRPKDWHLIWPELMDRPDAPPLPSPIPELPPVRAKRGRKPRAQSEPRPKTSAEKLAAAGIEHQGGD